MSIESNIDDLIFALSFDKPIWPNDWHQDVAFLAFYILGLKNEVKAQRDAVLKHHGERGHDRCQFSDQELYRAFGLDTSPANSFPSYDEAIAGCDKYCQKHSPDGAGRSVLEELAQLREAVNRMAEGKYY